MQILVKTGSSRDTKILSFIFRRNSELLEFNILKWSKEITRSGRKEGTKQGISKKWATIQSKF